MGFSFGRAVGHGLNVRSPRRSRQSSIHRGEGFENKLAELVARELGAELRYVWHAQRRGFCRETLKAGHADLVIGLPSEFELARTTNPYYRSTYVFVRRADDANTPRVSSFDDEALRRVKVGVQLIGDDGANTPPAHSLGRRAHGASESRPTGSCSTPPTAPRTT